MGEGWIAALRPLHTTLMPKLIQETKIVLTWSDMTGRVEHKRVTTDRSAGVHLMSGIIRPVLTKSGLLKTFVDKEQLDPEEMPLRMALGMAAEAWFVGLYPYLIWQPGEVTLDGVVGSPDGLTMDGGVIRPELAGEDVDEEWKVTWCSRNTYGQDITQHKLWMWQFAGYCKMIGCRFTRAHIIWACGDYKKGPPSPAYHTYLIEFTQQELDSFWTNIVLPNLPGAPEEKEQRA